MLSGKILACLEHEFQHGREGAALKGRDFYDLLWLMQKDVHPLEEKLAKGVMGLRGPVVDDGMLFSSGEGRAAHPQ